MKLAAVLFVLFSALAIIALVDNVLISFLLAFASAYLIAPVVSFLERWGLARSFAILIPFLSFASVVGFGIYLLFPIVTQQIETLQNELPKYIDGTKKLITEAQRQAELYLPISSLDIGTRAETFLLAWTQDFFSNLPAHLSSFATVLILAPFFAYFMLQDGRNLARIVLSMVPNNLFEVALNLQHEINKQMGAFIRARLLEAVIVGLVTWIGLWWISFPYATLLAAFAAITNLIPYLGPIIGAVPALLVALVNGYAGLGLIPVLTVYLVAQVIDAAIIVPLVVAKIVNLHPVTVVIVIIIGAQLLGVLGMVISIPVASILKLVGFAIYRQATDLSGRGENVR